ncbi:MAG: HAMP domain-containing histidine kinase [Eubacterium sp.]|nr:HAMP domain-containing histidine kinase [Eubacterium sp.]
MKKNFIDKIRNVLRSLKFRVFILIAVAVIVPTLVSSIFIYNVALDNYKEKRLETFDTANTVIKNTIENGHFFDEVAESAEATDNAVLQNNSQIEHLAKAYECRIQVINGKSEILYDSGNDVGKSSVSNLVQKGLKGQKKFLSNDTAVEYVVPISIAVENTDSDARIILGVVYTRYSIKDMGTYGKSVERYVSMVESLLVIFGLIIAWVLCIVFTNPIRRIEESITEISLGKKKENTNETPDEKKKKEENDYSEVMEISRDFKALVERLTTQVRSQQEFVSNVSHELKTPITSMKILADSLLGQEGVPEELYQEFLQDISKEIDRENNIITDLLELVRMEKSSTSVNISSVNINEIVETILRRLKPIAEEKNIELIFETFRPVIADVDEVKFASVVNNLVENAIKYNNTDGTVTTSLNSDHQYFYLKVTDSGIGISEEAQSRVFERFFRVDKARTRETGGSGLGLAITKEIVDKHHGSIKVHSKEGEGTTFTVRIPLKYIEQGNYVK